MQSDDPNAVTESNDETSGAGSLPIVIDLGKVKSRRIRQLKKGRGPLMNEVEGTVRMIQEQLGDGAGETVFVPIVMVYQKKPKKRIGLIDLLK